MSDLDSLMASIEALGSGASASTTEPTHITIGLSNPTPEPLSLPEKVLGYSRSYLAGPTFGFADNLEAAVSSGIKNSQLTQALSNVLGLGIKPSSYEQELGQIRSEQARFKDQTDYLDNAVEMAAGTILNPFSALSKAKTGIGALSNILNAPVVKPLTSVATSVPVQSAVAAYGTSDGDLEQTAQGALVGTAGSALSSVLGKVLSNPARQAERLKMSAYGIGTAPIAKQLKSLKNAGADLEDISKLPLLKSVQKMERLGLIDAGNDVIKNAAAVKDYRNKLGGTISNLLKEVDRFTPSNKNFALSNTLKEIDSIVGTDRELAIGIAKKELAAIRQQMATGTLDELQRIKINLKYTDAANPAVGGAVINAIKSDLRQAIEDRVNEAARKGKIPSKLQGSIKSLNREWGDTNDLYDALYATGARDLQGDIIEGGFMSQATTRGQGSANIMSAVTGNPSYAATGFIGNSLRYPEAKSGIANILADPALSKTFDVASQIIPETVTGANVARLASQPETQPQPKNQVNIPITELDDVMKSIERLAGGDMPKQKEEKPVTVPSPIPDPVVAKNPKLNRVANKLSQAGLDLSTLDALDIAQIRAESSGVVNIEGPKTRFGRAKGLMQLLDSTGKEWHKKLKLPGEYDPFNAEQNVTIGRAYRRFLEDRYDGDVRLALAAYNWGLGNLDRALAKTKSGSFEEVVSRLPSETRNYVAKIMGDITGTVKA